MNDLLPRIPVAGAEVPLVEEGDQLPVVVGRHQEGAVLHREEVDQPLEGVGRHQEGGGLRQEGVGQRQEEGDQHPVPEGGKQLEAQKDRSVYIYCVVCYKLLPTCS